MDCVTPKQLEVLRFIDGYIVRHGYSPTLEEIASHLGVIKPTVQQYLRALEDKGAIARKRYAHRSIQIVADEADASAGMELPLLGRIAAGEPIEAIEGAETVNVRDMLGLTLEDELFVLQVVGNSMIDEGIFDGDYVIIRRQSTAENGETIVALLPDNTATLKKFYRENGRIRLQPANPTMEPFYVEEVTIQGIVRGVFRPM